MTKYEIIHNLSNDHKCTICSRCIRSIDEHLVLAHKDVADEYIAIRRKYEEARHSELAKCPICRYEAKSIYRHVTEADEKKYSDIRDELQAAGSQLLLCNLDEFCKMLGIHAPTYDEVIQFCRKKLSEKNISFSCTLYPNKHSRILRQMREDYEHNDCIQIFYGGNTNNENKISHNSQTLG